jgi:hypothetical protein
MRPASVAKLQESSGKRTSFGIMVISQQNGGTSGQGLDDGKALVAVFFINHQNGLRQAAGVTRFTLHAGAPRKGGGKIR